MWSGQGRESLTLLLGLLTALTVVTSWRPHVQANSPAQTLDEFIRANPDLSEFFSLIGKSGQLSAALDWSQGTLFAFSDQSLNEFRKNNPDQLNNFTVLYHFANTVILTQQMEESSLSTGLPGSLPIWITKVGTSYYLNAAKILRPDRRVRIGKNQLEQIIHVIDKVLEPTIPKVNAGSSTINNPDAKKFLEFANDYTISGNYRTTVFFNQVQAKGRLNLFQDTGKHTFFIPVNEAFETTRIGSVDEKAIEGHMIVGKAVFLGPHLEGSSKHMTYEASAGASNFPVEVTLNKIGNTNSWQVTSENLVQDHADKPNHSHRKGRVQAQVLKANIPVKNGVVHLISKPLVVIDSNVFKTMEADNGPLKYFYELIKNARDTQGTGGQFEEIRRVLQDASKDKRVTVFVPTSRIFETSDNFQQLYNTSKPTHTNVEEREKALIHLAQIIKLHIVQQDITLENITAANKNKADPLSAKPLANDKTLFFNVVHSARTGRDSIAVVDSGGTSAIITQADIGATNGVIHQVDRVLGIGDNTIYDRLKTDPTFTRTYNISQQGRFSEVFKVKDQEFTFFVPINYAWDGVKYEAPTAYHTLFKGHHEGHARQIMERHLISRHLYTMADLHRISTGGHNKSMELKPIRTIRGDIRVIRANDTDFERHKKTYGILDPRVNSSRFPGSVDYIIFWGNREIRVVNADVKCSNGYIHVIDTVLMTQEDVMVNSVNSIFVSSVTMSVLMMAVAWLLAN